MPRRYKNKLQKFYAVHNPEKLSEVGALLAKYQGREDDLWVALQQKYGRDFIRNFEVKEQQQPKKPSPPPLQVDEPPSPGWDGGAAANWGAAAKI
jgi:hypothetical protein